MVEEAIQVGCGGMAGGGGASKAVVPAPAAPPPSSRSACGLARPRGGARGVAAWWRGAWCAVCARLPALLSQARPCAAGTLSCRGASCTCSTVAGPPPPLPLPPWAATCQACLSLATLAPPPLPPYSERRPPCRCLLLSLASGRRRLAGCCPPPVNLMLSTCEPIYMRRMHFPAKPTQLNGAYSCALRGLRNALVPSTTRPSFSNEHLLFSCPVFPVNTFLFVPCFFQ